MKLIKADEAKSGQTVAKDVTDLKGVLLFKSGTTLTETILQRIKSRSITHIFIDEGGGGSGSGGSGNFKTAEDVDKAIDQVFGDIVSNPLMAELCEAAKRYHKSQIG